MAYSLIAVPRVTSMFLMTVPKLSLSSVVLWSWISKPLACSGV